MPKFFKWTELQNSNTKKNSYNGGTNKSKKVSFAYMEKRLEMLLSGESLALGFDTDCMLHHEQVL